MSRIGTQTISVPQGVTISRSGSEFKVKGPKGTLSVDTHGRVEVAENDGKIGVARVGESRQSRAYHGLYQRLINNCVQGVVSGFSKELEINGVGYRAALNGKALSLSLGFSHPVNVDPPEGIEFEVPKQTVVIIKGIDKQKVGQIAAEIRRMRPVEPYNGKGVKYAGELVIRKAGKSAK